MKFKLTMLERNWVLYDVGNSAFTLLVSTILPIYFNYLSESAGISEVQYLAYWGYAISISTAIVAVMGPTLGTLSDVSGMRKKMFTISLIVGAAACVIMGFTVNWLFFLGIFLIARVGYSFSLVIYDSMLIDVTDDERMDRVSSHGYAWGYIGSCVPFVVCLVFVLMYDSMGISFSAAMIIALAIIAVWWFLMSCPLIKSYEQKHSLPKGSTPMKDSLIRLSKIFKELAGHPQVLLFLLAFFFYIDGVYTIIDMATTYGTALGLDTTGLLLALLVTQIVAFPFSLFFGRLSKKVAPEKLIGICIAAYFCIAIYAIFLDKQYEFWILAVAVGMFQGTIQAMSRSFFAKIIPPEQSGEYFGIYDICGKGASIMGSLVFSIAAQVTGLVNAGVGMLAIMFIIGGVLFWQSVKLGK